MRQTYSLPYQSERTIWPAFRLMLALWALVVTIGVSLTIFLAKI
jgi:hypothetical protein